MASTSPSLQHCPRCGVRLSCISADYVCRSPGCNCRCAERHRAPAPAPATPTPSPAEAQQVGASSTDDENRRHAD